MQLNLMTDDGAQNLKRFYQESLLENTQPIDRYEAYFTLGLLAWRSGKSGETYSLLNCAAGEAIYIIEARDNKNIAAVRIPHSVAIPFLVVINFGDQALINRAAKIPRSQWFQPESLQYKPLADLLDILRHYSACEKLDRAKLELLLQQNQDPAADNFYKPWIASLAQGLLAIAANNSEFAKTHLQELLLLHEDMAFEGGWGNLAEGLMSFWALTLFNIGKKENINLSVEMFYLYH